MAKTLAQWGNILAGLGVDAAGVQKWAPIFYEQCDLDGTALAYFLGQIMHESGRLRHLEENLNYTSADRIRAVWPSRFREAGDAEACVRNPIKLANIVYAKRMGNMDPGDGWKFRGRGLIQVTGKGNYWVVGQAIGVDLVANPDLLAQPEYALRSALAWWRKNMPTSAIGDVARITKIVNGGTAGLDQRTTLTTIAMGEINAA